MEITGFISASQLIGKSRMELARKKTNNKYNNNIDDNTKQLQPQYKEDIDTDTEPTVDHNAFRKHVILPTGRVEDGPKIVKDAFGLSWISVDHCTPGVK